MRWTGHVAYMEEKRNAYKLLVGKDHSEDLGINERIIFLH
jgi:hypothetical protein